MERKSHREKKSQDLARLQQNSRALFSALSHTLLISANALKRLIIQLDFYESGFHGKAFVNADCKLKGWFSGCFLKDKNFVRLSLELTSVSNNMQ